MDRKGIIALALCAIILIVYFPVILPMLSPEKDKQKTQETTGSTPEQSPGQNVFEGLTPAPQQAVTQTPKTEPAISEAGIDAAPQDSYIDLQDNIVIQNENIIAVWSNEGAALKSVTLKKYKDFSKTKEMDIIRPATNTMLPLTISTIKVSNGQIFEELPLKDLRFKVVGNTKDKISFQTTLKNGLQVIKNVSFDPDKYHLNMEIGFRNTTDQNISCEYNLTAASGVVYEGDARMDMATVVGIDRGNGSYKLVKTALKNLPESNESVGIAWAGTVNKYFAAVLKPKTLNCIASASSRPLVGTEEAIEDFMVSVKTKAVNIPPHQDFKHEYIVFLGPKLGSLLAEYNFENLLGFGIFKAISNILLKILNGFYKIIPNYGVSILFLTLLVKLMLFPLTRKSQTSMFKMQALQPEIEKLKVKFKGDKQKVAKAQMELFKKHGANPLGGCLPMVLQMPVFFALFRTLQLSFEMRQAPFTLWIGDLSVPDTLLTLPFTLPVFGDMLNVLPFIMTGASFIQTKLNPKTPSADPQARMQQKMMQYMPLMFCFILYKMPSGLTLYWTTSTILGIAENLFIRKTLKKIKNKRPILKG